MSLRADKWENENGVKMEENGGRKMESTLFFFSPKNTAKIQIQYNEEILIEINPNSKLLYDAVDSIPDYGFINNPEQRRNALHNKIEVVEKMIERNNIKGTIQKLEHDIKDKFIFITSLQMNVILL